jgi:hypothetical protein
VRAVDAVRAVEATRNEVALRRMAAGQAAREAIEAHRAAVAPANTETSK